jgi:hypothetical protein
VFVGLSLALALFWPVFFGLGEYTGSLLIGVVLVSYSRLRGAKLGVPCPELVFIVCARVGGYLFAFLPSSKIASVDELLLKFDGNFGYVEALAGKLFRMNQVIEQILEISYWVIPLAGVLVYLGLRNEAMIRRRYIVTNGLVTLIFCFYRLCPAAGPRPLIGTAFPNAIPDLANPHAQIIPGITLNAMPSGHFTWALLLFWFARRYGGRGLRIGASVYLFLIGLATLGKGEHYVIDLIVAVPFAAGVWALGEGRWKRAGATLLVVFLWCMALGQGWALILPRLVAWLLSAMTVIPFVPGPEANLFGRLHYRPRILPEAEPAGETGSTM